MHVLSRSHALRGNESRVRACITSLTLNDGGRRLQRLRHRSIIRHRVRLRRHGVQVHDANDARRQRIRWLMNRSTGSLSIRAHGVAASQMRFFPTRKRSLAIRFTYMKYADLYVMLVVFPIAGPAAAADANALVSIENDALRISLAVEDASLTVTDKRIGLVWRRRVALDSRSLRRV